MMILGRGEVTPCHTVVVTELGLSCLEKYENTWRLVIFSFKENQTPKCFFT